MNKIPSLMLAGSAILALNGCDPKSTDTIRDTTASNARSTLGTSNAPKTNQGESDIDFLDRPRPLPVPEMIRLSYAQRKNMNDGILLENKESQDRLTFFGHEIYRNLNNVQGARYTQGGLEVELRKQEGYEGRYHKVYATVQGHFSYVDHIGNEKVTWNPLSKQLTIGSGDLSCSNGHSGNFVCYGDINQVPVQSLGITSMESY